CSIACAQSASEAFCWIVVTGELMQSEAHADAVSRPSATIRTAMSRSVTTPTGRPDSRLSTTGISPQSFSTIIRATSRNGVSPVQQAGLAAITLFRLVFMETPTFGGDPYPAPLAVAEP